jgi:CubicO group peptidase (beta-lactamase class C family)
MISLWTRRPAEAIRVDAARSARIDNFLAGEIHPEQPGMAVAVVKSGAIVHAAGYGSANSRAEPVRPNTIFHLASCGKQFTGLGILMLAEERRLRLDDPIGKHLPWLSGYGPEVTLRRLLHHTSGIRDLYDDDGVADVLERCERPTNDDIIRTFADLGCPMAEPGCRPGDTFAYSNSGYDLLGSVIEKVSGQSFHDFLQRRVFERLAMNDTFAAPDRRVADPRRATGYILEDGQLIEHGGTELDDVGGSGSCYTTVSDLCIYDRALAANALISAASMREALTSGRTNDGTLTNYGFGWSLADYEGMRIAEHEGEWIGCRSYMGRFLDVPLSVFLLTNHPTINLVDVSNEAFAAYGR